MPQLTPDELLRIYPERDFLVAEGGVSSAYMIAIHEAFYSFAADRLEGGLVVDAGCGTGFGTKTLLEGADRAVGIDLKQEVLDYGQQQYATPCLEFACMDAGDLAFDDGSVDAIVANELIEHLPDHLPFMSESVRVLRPGGLFISATVNRVHTFGSGDDPLNRNHFREYDAADFRTELERYFEDVEILGQGFDATFRKYMKSRPARGIEWVLTALKVKHRIPAAWRSTVRGWITGARAAELTPDEFRVTGDNVEQSLYLVGVARRRARDDNPGPSSPSTQE